MRIVCAGDSLTRGVSFERGRLRILRDNYPKLLQEAFDERSDSVEIVNRGVFNDNSDLLLERLDKDVLSLHPDAVLIEIGGNDCNFRWDEVAKRPDADHEPYVPLPRYIDNITALVKKIRSAGATPVVMTLVPLHPVRYYKHLAATFGTEIAHWIALCGGIEYWHRGYDDALRKRLSQLGVNPIDVRKPFEQLASGDNFISLDGIHLTADGYRWLTQVVLDGLSARFEQVTLAART